MTVVDGTVNHRTGHVIVIADAGRVTRARAVAAPHKTRVELAIGAADLVLMRLTRGTSPSHSPSVAAPCAMRSEPRLGCRLHPGQTRCCTNGFEYPNGRPGELGSAKSFTRFC